MEDIFDQWLVGKICNVYIKTESLETENYIL